MKRERNDTTTGAGALSEEEGALYDRQIRLWGVAAQQRMRHSRVLLCCLGGILTEVCKNLVLAGVGSVTICDPRVVAASDLAAQFFVQEADIGTKRVHSAQARIQALNPKVELEVLDMDVSQMSEERLQVFNVICASDCSHSTMIWLDKICRKHSIAFYGTESFGYYAYFFADLNGHEYSQDEIKEDTETKGQKEPPTKKPRTDHMQPQPIPLESIATPSLEDVTNISWHQSALRRTSKLFFALQVLWHWREQNQKYPSLEDVDRLVELKNLMCTQHGVAASFVPDTFILNVNRMAQSDMSAVCAIVGGILGQQVIKVVTGRDEPCANFFFYDATNSTGSVELIAPTSLCVPIVADSVIEL